LHAGLSTLTHVATILARAQAGQLDRMRRMRVKAPAGGHTPREHMRLAT
jgi:hypothetical protein